MSVFSALSHKDVTWSNIENYLSHVDHISPLIGHQIKIESTYAVYMERQKRDVDSIRAEESRKIPDDIDFLALSGLSSELALKLQKIKPENLSQASRIEGMTPSALTLILGFIKRNQRQKAL